MCATRFLLAFATMMVAALIGVMLFINLTAGANAGTHAGADGLFAEMRQAIVSDDSIKVLSSDSASRTMRLGASYAVSDSEAEAQAFVENATAPGSVFDRVAAVVDSDGNATTATVSSEQIDARVTFTCSVGSSEFTLQVLEGAE